MKTKLLLRAPLLAAALCLTGQAYAGGFWFANPANVDGINESIGICLLLTDGTVLAEGTGTTWWELAPDEYGNYYRGQWSQRSSSNWGHQDGSTTVLPSGKVFVAGGENGTGPNTAEIYDPVADSWSVAVNPTPWNINDGNSMLMPNGQVLIAPQDTNIEPGLAFLFNPSNNTFSQTGTPVNSIWESTWVKLPNDNVLVIDSDDSSSPGAFGLITTEMYNPNTGTWEYIADLAPDIWPNVTGSGYVSEMGPAFLLPNGQAIFFGGGGVTAVYNNGTWSQGATIPNSLGMKDGPGAMMVNGNILLAVCPTGMNSDSNAINGIGPTSFYEYDYTENSGAGGYTLAPSPGFGISVPSSQLRFLDLPDGTVLLSTGTSQVYFYDPTNGVPLTAGQPTVQSATTNSNGSLHLTGTLFNGISQGASYGDDAQMDTDFPLVRFTDASGIVRYGHTYNWDVCVGTNKMVSTDCDLPAGASLQDTIQVVANGIASSGVYYPLYSTADTVYVDYSGSLLGTGTISSPFNTIHLGLLFAGQGGIVTVAGGHQTSGGDGIIKISTPVRITAWPGKGTASIGPN